MKNLLDFTPNEQQSEALTAVSAFLESERDVFILKGSAGTGKTSILKAVTSHLNKKSVNFYLSAPTGRAAMIIGSKTSSKARTMHSTIYTPEKTENGVGIKLIRKINKESDFTVFLVDEASMVSNTVSNSENFVVSRPLLIEFIEYVKQGNPNNKLIFIGDRFQLPPINENFSPALHSKFLKNEFGLKCSSYSLSQVMRQQEGSSTLGLATELRNSLNNGFSNGKVNISREAYPSYALRKYLDSYDQDSLDKVVTICGSNRDVDYWNNWVRRELGFGNTQLSVGDQIVNQATWINNKGEWIHKGQLGKVVSLNDHVVEKVGLRFIEAELDFESGKGNYKRVSSKILLDSLNTRYGNLSSEKEHALAADAMKHNPVFRKSRNHGDDEYLSAFRLKHSYAMTCHKAQGGEWDNVLIHPYMLERDLQWAYTAVTRAREDVFSYAA